MNLSSMTGFARVGGSAEIDGAAYAWNWEIKSVNGKALDLKFKLPPEWDDKEAELKNAAARFFSRGSFSIALTVDNPLETAAVKINMPLLEKLAEAAISLYQKHSEVLAKPNAAELMALKGVVESGDNLLEEEKREELWRQILAGFEKGCALLQQDRRNEGAKIQAALGEILLNISAIVARIDEMAGQLPQQMKKKLEEQISQWLEPGNALSEERLAQEAVLYITRADIREEADRLKAHVKTAGELLKSSEAVGRRLDFLWQELNREANTTCSKSCDTALTNLGIGLKALIEQFREQIQNIE